MDVLHIPLVSPDGPTRGIIKNYLHVLKKELTESDINYIKSTIIHTHALMFGNVHITQLYVEDAHRIYIPRCYILKAVTDKNLTLCTLLEKISGIPTACIQKAINGEKCEHHDAAGKNMHDITNNIVYNTSPYHNIHPEAFSIGDYKLTNFQDTVGRGMFKWLFNKALQEIGAAGGILDLPCGVGKTFMGINTMKIIGLRTLVITNTSISVKQWIDTLRKRLPKAIVKDFYEDVEDISAIEQCTDVEKKTAMLSKTASIVVSTVHPIALPNGRVVRASNKAWCESFGCVIYDEIHLLGADIFSRIFSMVTPKFQLGLSATPERVADALNCRYETLIGPIFNPAISMNLEMHPPKFPGEVHCVYFSNNTTDEYSKWHYKGKDKKDIDIQKSNQYVTADPALYGVLDYWVLRHVGHSTPDAQHCFGVLIFCKTQSEVDKVQHHLDGLTIHMENGNDRPLKARKVYGSTSDDATTDAIENADVIIGTFEKIGTAFSEHRFIYAVMWSPIKMLAKQSVQRTTRYNDNDHRWNECLREILDVRYVGAMATSLWSKHRDELYHSLGWRIIRKGCSWNGNEYVYS